MNIRTRSGSQPSEMVMTVDNFRGGYTSLVDEARMAKNFAFASVNLVQVQDGIWQTRWGRDYYGQAISGENSIDGVSQYVAENGNRELIAVGGTTGKIFKSVNGGAWTQIGTKTLTPGHDVSFIQIANQLYIANGVNNLIRYDGTNLLEYNALSAPTGLTATRGGGLSTGSYNYYYQVTAVTTVGETTASTEASVSVNIERSSWAGDTQCVDLAWNAVAGAERYYVYFADESGWEQFLAEVTTNSFKDDGSLVPNSFLEPPDENTTAAPKFSVMEVSGNRIWATKSPDAPWRTYFSGTGVNLGRFSVWYGGGWVDLEKGGVERPVSIVHYRTGKGDPIITVLCSSPEGLGSIWQIELSSITVNGVSIVVPIVYKVVGSIGANSSRSVVKAKDNIFFANKRGIFALRNKEQMFQVLATDELSAPIRPDYTSLNKSKIDNLCSYFYDGKVFFSGAVGSENDTTFIFDIERGNWTWKWTFGAKHFLEYTDNNGTSRFLYVPESGNRLVEINERFVGDFGQPFEQLYLSPLFPVSKNKTDVLKLKQAIVELGRPRGQIVFEVLGIGKNGTISTIGARTIGDVISGSGFGFDQFSDFLFSDTWGTPETFSQASYRKVLPVRGKVYNLQFKISSSSADTKFAILSLQAKGRILSKRPPSRWSN